jgi:hypothetical protein
VKQKRKARKNGTLRVNRITYEICALEGNGLLHLNRRQRRSFESELSSADIIDNTRVDLRKRGLLAAILVTKSTDIFVRATSTGFYDLSAVRKLGFFLAEALNSGLCGTIKSLRF